MLGKDFTVELCPEGDYMEPIKKMAVENVTLNPGLPHGHEQ